MFLISPSSLCYGPANTVLSVPSSRSPPAFVSLVTYCTDHRPVPGWTLLASALCEDDSWPQPFSLQGTPYQYNHITIIWFWYFKGKQLQYRFYFDRYYPLVLVFRSRRTWLILWTHPPPWHSRSEARGLYLSVSLYHCVDMNAKCAAAANRMLNEVEMTGAWLLAAPLKPWHTNSTLVIYSGYTGAVAEWRCTVLFAKQ